jgi:hypothetical protein
MAEKRKCPMPSSAPSEPTTVYSSSYPHNRTRESANAPTPTGVRKPVPGGKAFTVTSESGNKVD